MTNPGARDIGRDRERQRQTDRQRAADRHTVTVTEKTRHRYRGIGGGGGGRIPREFAIVSRTGSPREKGGYDTGSPSEHL